MATVTLNNQLINQLLRVPFLSVNLVTGKTVFPNITFLVDGAVTAISYATTEIGNGLYTLNFTPASTGIYTIFVEQTIAATASIVSRTVDSYLKNIEDEAIGSWVWDKTTGRLNLVRQDGTPLAVYAVVDDLTIASRSRTS